MPYKPTGQMLGNVSHSAIDSQTPANRASVPGGITAQTSGTSMLAWGEGADSASLNRPLAALARNTDYLRAKMAAPIAVARNIDDTGIADLSVAAGTDISLAPTPAVFDGWMYTGSVLADIDLYVRLINRDGSDVRTSTGTLLTVSDIQTAAGVSMVGVPQTVASSVAVTQPLGEGVHPRHFIKFATAVLQAQIGAATARGLRVAISGSTATTATEGTNNGNFVVVNGTGDGTEFTLAEYKYRVRFYYHGAPGTPAAEVVTGPNGSGTVTFTSSDYLEFTAVTGTFAPGDVITGASLGSATVIRFTAPGDPVILNNRGAGTVIATFTTDGNWINTAFTSAPKIVMSGSLGGAADRLVQLGGLTTLEQLGAGGFLSFGYSSPSTDLNRAYEVGRTITADLGAITINTATTAEAVSIVRTSGSGSVNIFNIKDGVTTYFAQVFDDAAADAPDYTYAYRLNTDLIRSYTYRKTSTGRTSAIGLSTSDGNVALRSGTSGGTETDVLVARKSSSTATIVEIRSPAGTGVMTSGDNVYFSITDEMMFHVNRTGDVITCDRYGTTQGTIDGVYASATDNYQYINGGAHAVHGDVTGIAVDTFRGFSLLSEYQKYLVLTLTSCSKTFEVGEAVTHSSGGTGFVLAVGINHLEVLGYTGTWVDSGTVAGTTSTATATVTALITGRSKVKLKKIDGVSGTLTGTQLLSVDQMGGFCPPDADSQSPLMTVPDLTYATAKYTSYDVPVTLLAAQSPGLAGGWIPADTENGGGASIQFGMQTTILASNAGYIPVPPYTMGVSSLLLSVASVAGISVGDIVYNATGQYWIGVVTEKGTNQIRVQVTQNGIVTAGCTIQGGSTYATAYTTPDWTTTTSTAVSSPVIYEAKTQLVGVEVSCRGSLFGSGGGGNSDRVRFQLRVGTTTLDTQTVEFATVGAYTFSSLSILLGASLASPTSYGVENYTVKIDTPDVSWDASSWFHIHKVRAFVRAFSPNPTI